MPISVPTPVRSFLREPAVANPPPRVWRDWVLVAAASLSAILEATLRTDTDWTGLPLGWRLASVAVFFTTIPWAILHRRTRPLAAIAVSFVPTLMFGVVVRLAEGVVGSLVSSSVVVVMIYAVYRWGSGRDGAWGAVLLLVAAVVGTLTDPNAQLGDAIGGPLFLVLIALTGLAVRYQSTARVRAIAEVKSNERAELARELHDTVAHHVSAIAIQAQAGRAVAATDPRRAIDQLAVIEAAASRTLAEMRAMVGSLRAADGAPVASLRPQPGVANLGELANVVPAGVRFAVTVDESADPPGQTVGQAVEQTVGQTIGPAVDAAVYRIAQESVTNAVRHARHATRIHVRVTGDADMVRLTVADDGRASGGANGHGFGLISMSERAHLIGGSLSAGPGADGGWLVTAVLPRDGVPG